MKKRNNVFTAFFMALIMPFVFAIQQLNDDDSGALGTTEIEKAIGEIDEIIHDVAETMKEDSPGGKSIVWTERFGLVFSDTGKLIKILSASGVIWDEIKDLKTAESPAIVAALEKIYTPENPFVKEAAEKLVVALIAIKEAGVAFAKAKDWIPE